MDGESNMTDGEQRGLEQYFYVIHKKLPFKV